MRPNSIIRYARLREALYLDDDQAMAVQLARITVLYEDLRIELDSLRSFQNLAGPNDEFRVMYFIRRSLATLHEFIEAITELGKQPHFQSVEATWPEDARIRLKQLRSELGSATQRVAILRNNVGGHFGEDGVAAALKHRKLWDAIARLELDRNNHGIVASFATQVVAAVFVRHSPGFDPSNLESVIMDTMHWWRELLKIAIECGQIILSYVVLPKFN